MYITQLNAIKEYIKNNMALELLVSSESENKKELIKMAKERGVKIVNLKKEALNRLLKTTDHKKIALKIKNNEREEKTLDEYLKEFKKLKKVLILILDGIEDPQNYGAILRTAEQFAVNLVISPKRKSAKESEAVIRVSSGASQYVNKIYVSNINFALEKLKSEGFWIYASDVNGESIHSLKIESEKVALIMGNEAKGIHKSTREAADFLIKIPTSGKIDSLNVSVATGILIFEIKRQLALI